MRASDSMAGAVSVILVAAWSASTLAGPARPVGSQRTKAAASPRVEGLTAWHQVYSGLTQPRCLNCHTATDYPQQGDDRHRHFANVHRGPAGPRFHAVHTVTCHP